MNSFVKSVAKRVRRPFKNASAFRKKWSNPLVVPDLYWEFPFLPVYSMREAVRGVTSRT